MLLVHGFPGTPLEMRILAKRLNELGYDTKGVLMHDFGTDIDQLEDQKSLKMARAPLSGDKSIQEIYLQISVIVYLFAVTQILVY